MKVSVREEQLAEELYTWDMSVHDGEFVPWSQQIEPVKNSFRKQAMRVVNSRWFKRQMSEASLTGAYREAVARDEADLDNGKPGVGE